MSVITRKGLAATRAVDIVARAGCTQYTQYTR